MGQTRPVADPCEILDVEGVCVTLSGRQILDNVTFGVRAGEFTGLIGSNGAGKTTLLRVILGLQRPSAGTISVAGAPRTRRNQSIGYVPQKVVLDPDMPLRARDLVGLGIDGHRFGLPVPSKKRREAVDEMLHAVDAERFADSRVGNLSGGEQQRVLIAHALIGRPRLLLLDEPSMGLAPNLVDQLLTVIRALRDDSLTILLVEQNARAALAIADRAYVLETGRVTLSGPAAEIQADRRVREAYLGI